MVLKFLVVALFASACVSEKTCEADGEIGAMQIHKAAAKMAKMQEVSDSKIATSSTVDSSSKAALGRIKALKEMKDEAIQKRIKLNRQNVEINVMTERRNRCSVLTSCSPLAWSSQGPSSYVIGSVSCGAQKEMWVSTMFKEEPRTEPMGVHVRPGAGTRDGYPTGHQAWNFAVFPRPDPGSPTNTRTHSIKACCCPKVQTPCWVHNADNCRGQKDVRPFHTVDGVRQFNFDDAKSNCVVAKIGASGVCEPWTTDSSVAILPDLMGTNNCFQTGRKCEPAGVLELQLDRYQSDVAAGQESVLTR